jgi:putative transposase
MALLAYCLMPNHFHLVARPERDGDLSRWMQWLLTAHVREHHKRNATVGRVWQGRYKSFPIQEDMHLLTVLRYVERNPLRAGLVSKAEDWPWSSLRWWKADSLPFFLEIGPVRRPPDWVEFVNEPQTEAEQEAVRTCVRRQRPCGDDSWVLTTAHRLDLLWTLRNRGSREWSME